MNMRYLIPILFLSILAINTNGQDDKQNKLNSKFLSAVAKSNLPKAEEILAEGADIDALNEYKITALMISIQNKSEELAKLLINKGANTNMSNKAGTTTLMLAIKYSGPDIINLLLDKGAEVNATNNEGMTPLCMAYAYSTSEIINIIMEKDEKNNLSGPKADETFSIDNFEFSEEYDSAETDLTFSETVYGLYLKTINNNNNIVDISGWSIGAKHTWRGVLNYADYTFYSNPNDELQFEVTKDSGYKYIKGCGVVIKPDNSKVLLKDKKIEGYITSDIRLCKIHGKVEAVSSGGYMVCILEPFNDDSKCFNADFCGKVNNKGEFEITSTVNNLTSEFSNKDSLLIGIVSGGTTTLFKFDDNKYLMDSGKELIFNQNYIKLKSDNYPSIYFSSDIFKEPVTDIGILKVIQ